MPDLGNRANVMGPQPIAQRKPVPPEMIAAVERILNLLAQGDRAGLEAIAAPKALGQVTELVQSVRPGAYNGDEIIAHARVNKHYFVKAKLTGPGVEPFLIQIRVGDQDGRWLIFEARNLTGRRSAWTR